MFTIATRLSFKIINRTRKHFAAMIVINGKFLFQRKTGVQRYAYEITSQLIKSDIDVRIIIPAKGRIDNCDIPDHYFIRMGFFTNLNLWEQLDIPLYLIRNKSLLLLSLCNTGPVLAKKQIVCIHDMSYAHNPLWFSRGFYMFYNFLIPKLAKSALHIITVSEFSKREICNKLKVHTGKVSVVYNAPAALFKLPTANDIHFPKENYFLFVGSHDPRKNIALLLNVFALREYKDERLVIVGAPSKNFNNQDLAASPNVEFVTNCDDIKLAGYYKHAKALISSSFYEGFGLSVVEASAGGCPLIISNIPSFKEIVDSNAFYFDPYSKASLKIAINNFLGKSDDQLHLAVINNYDKCFKFSWENSSERLLNIIQSLNYGLY